MKFKHSCTTHPDNACVACLAAQANDAIREEETVDYGPLSHAERNALLRSKGII